MITVAPAHKFQENWLNPDLLDCRLTEKGRKECEAIQEVSNQLKIDTVFVSPMRRAIQTAYYVFKSHPDFEKINFVICPYIRELLGTTCDIPSKTIDVLEEFSPLFPNLDTSLIKCYKFKAEEDDDCEGAISDAEVPSLPKMIYSEINGKSFLNSSCS